MSLLQIANSGPEIVSTNYWQSEHAARGFFYLSANAGAYRLLVPDVQAHAVAEMMAAKEVIISRGPWPDQNRADGLEILFEDGSDSPFCLHLVAEQCDRLPGNQDRGERAFSVWTSGGKHFELPCFCRMVKRIPWMKPYLK